MKIDIHSYSFIYLIWKDNLRGKFLNDYLPSTYDFFLLDNNQCKAFWNLLIFLFWILIKQQILLAKTVNVTQCLSDIKIILFQEKFDSPSKWHIVVILGMSESKDKSFGLV